MLRLLDLFSGIGGMSLGLELTGGFQTVAFCENARHPRRVLQKNWPGVPVFEDVRTIEYDGPVEIITSGDPCQRDSRANAKRDGESMWPWTLRCVQRNRPVYVLRENVLGNIDTGTLEQVESDLETEGYVVRSYDIPARAVGAGHDRPRTWTLAYSDSIRREKCNDAPKPGAPEQWNYPVLTGPDGLCWVGSEPPVLRRADDVPYRVDRIRELGNSLPHRIPYVFGLSILRHFEATK